MAKILVVDHVPNDAIRLAYDLEDQGHEVLGAGDGNEALELAAAEHPDLILLDVMTPEPDGIEVCRRLKADTEFSAIPVILVAAKDGEEEIVKGLRAGADDYLAKPIAKEVLATRVNCVLRTKADRDTIARVNEQLQTEIAGRERIEEGEAELLSNTFMASIQMLVDFLELLYPDCVSLTARVARIVKDICAGMQMENPWDVEVATMLSQVGCVVVSPEILKRLSEGEELSFAERRAFLKHPQVAADIIRRIPRMESVARIVEYQERRFDGEGPPFDDRITREKEIPLGARILKLALDFDALLMLGSTNHEAMELIRSRENTYDPAIVEVLGERVVHEPEYEVRPLFTIQLRPGMVLAEHVLSRDKSVLIRNGKTLTRKMLKNLHRYRDVSPFADRIREPIRVRVPVDRNAEVEQAEPEGSAT